MMLLSATFTLCQNENENATFICKSSYLLGSSYPLSLSQNYRLLRNVWRVGDRLEGNMKEGEQDREGGKDEVLWPWPSLLCSEASQSVFHCSPIVRDSLPTGRAWLRGDSSIQAQGPQPWERPVERRDRTGALANKYFSLMTSYLYPKMTMDTDCQKALLKIMQPNLRCENWKHKPGRLSEPFPCIFFR